MLHAAETKLAFLLNNVEKNKDSSNRNSKEPIRTVPTIDLTGKSLDSLNEKLKMIGRGPVLPISKRTMNEMSNSMLNIRRRDDNISPYKNNSLYYESKGSARITTSNSIRESNDNCENISYDSASQERDNSMRQSPHRIRLEEVQGRFYLSYKN